jgi:nitrite reductase/ring-hydroxylating ferredoxin subunit
MSDDDLSRREFVRATGITLAICPFIPACEFIEFKDTEVGQEAVFDVSDSRFSPLQETGGMTCVSAGALDLLLVRSSGEQIKAFERFCPHQNNDMAGNCPDGDNPFPATINTDEKQLQCNWHGATFSFDGEIISWPDDSSRERLETFPVDFDPETGIGTVLIGEDIEEESEV